MNDKTSQDQPTEPTEPTEPMDILAQMLGLAKDQLGLLEKIAPSVVDKLSQQQSDDIGIEELSEIIILPISPRDLGPDDIKIAVAELAEDTLSVPFEVFWIDPEKPERGALFIQLSIDLSRLAPILALPWVRRVELPQKVSLEPGHEK